MLGIKPSLIVSALTWGRLLTMGCKGKIIQSSPSLSTDGNVGISCVDWAWCPSNDPEYFQIFLHFHPWPPTGVWELLLVWLWVLSGLLGWSGRRWQVMWTVCSWGNFRHRVTLSAVHCLDRQTDRKTERNLQVVFKWTTWKTALDPSMSPIVIAFRLCESLLLVLCMCVILPCNFSLRVLQHVWFTTFHNVSGF